MFVFRKIWRTLFSWNSRFEIQPFALLPTKYENSGWNGLVTVKVGEVLVYEVRYKQHESKLGYGSN